MKIVTLKILHNVQNRAGTRLFLCENAVVYALDLGDYWIAQRTEDDPFTIVIQKMEKIKESCILAKEIGGGE